MANTVSLILEKYTDDFGKEYENVTFKVGINPNINLSNPINGGANKVRCSSRRYFSMRKAILLFSDGSSIEIPLPSLDEIPSIITTYKAQSNIECVGIKGERWRVIPPALLGNTYATTPIAVADASDTSKFFYNYQLSGSDQSFVRSTSLEVEPDVIFKAQQECLDKITGAVGLNCSFNAGITPRKFIGTRGNATTGGSIKRQIIVSSSETATIKKCGQDIMGNFNCLGYQGESIKDAFDFYN